MPVLRRSKFLIVATCTLVFAAFAVLVLTKPITQDEGVFLTIGKYLNQGWLPYQDMVDHKPPAIHFLFAALFMVFGTSVWVIKIALIASVAGTAVLLGKISELLKPGAGWYAATIFLFLMTQFEGYFLITEPFMLLPLLLCIWLILRWSQSGRSMFVAGVCAAIVTLFKQTGILSVLPLLLLVYKAPKKSIMSLVAGFVVPFLALGIYLFAKREIGEAWHQVVTLTLMSYPREPLGYILQSLKTNFTWTLPIWMLALVGLSTKIPNKKILGALVLLPLPFMFFRHYPHYWVQVLPFVALISAAVLVKFRKPALTVATLVFCLAIANGKVSQDMGPNYNRLRAQFDVAKILRDDPAKVVLAENQFSGFYFLLPQKNLNKFLYITEITNAVGAEQQTISDLQRSQSVIILWPEDPNFAYAKDLQKFILENGVTEKEFLEMGMRVMGLH